MAGRAPGGGGRVCPLGRSGKGQGRDVRRDRVEGVCVRGKVYRVVGAGGRDGGTVALGGAGAPVDLAPNNVYLNMVEEKFPNLRFDEAREVA